MKNLLLFTFCFFSLILDAQQTSVKHSYNNQSNLQPNINADSLDLYFSFPCIAFDGEFGIAEDYHDDEIYTTQWTGDSIARYSIDGNLIEKFVIPDVNNIRDLAYDGQFFYGGSNDTVLYVMDFNIRTSLLQLIWLLRFKGLHLTNGKNYSGYVKKAHLLYIKLILGVRI